MLAFLHRRGVLGIWSWYISNLMKTDKWIFRVVIFLKDFKMREREKKVSVPGRGEKGDSVETV